MGQRERWGQGRQRSGLQRRNELQGSSLEGAGYLELRKSKMHRREQRAAQPATCDVCHTEPVPDSRPHTLVGSLGIFQILGQAKLCS